MLLAPLLRRTSVLALLCFAPLTHASSPVWETTRSEASSPQPQVPTELFEVVKIVDGDTIHIMRNGKKEKLRLLSVDTEEKLTPGQRSGGSKPQTVYGEETRLWTIDYFEQFRDGTGLLRVGIKFPEDKEARDIYGRLLCHVLASDGTDFNLLLVQLGKSPYFNKYGNSLICHQQFVEAQVEAKRNLIGVWNPRVNRSSDGTSPSVGRPYDQLLPWWQVRAEAIESYRVLSQRQPGIVIAADEPDALQKALESKSEVRVFGSPDRFFDEDDGSRTVLFRATDKKRALRINLPKSTHAAFEKFDLTGLRSEFRQNYVYVTGTITKGSRGYRLDAPDLSQWTRAGAEPAE